MSIIETINIDTSQRMEGAIEALKQDLEGLRAGRASPALLNSLTVEAYGNKVPINQAASVSAQEGRVLIVNIWDKTNG